MKKALTKTNITVEYLKNRYELEDDEYVKVINGINNPNLENLELVLKEIASRYYNLEEFENDGDYEKIFTGVIFNKLKYKNVDFVIYLELALANYDDIKTLIKNK